MAEGKILAFQAIGGSLPIKKKLTKLTRQKKTHTRQKQQYFCHDRNSVFEIVLCRQGVRWNNKLGKVNMV